MLTIEVTNVMSRRPGGAEYSYGPRTGVSLVSITSLTNCRLSPFEKSTVWPIILPVSGIDRGYQGS